MIVLPKAALKAAAIACAPDDGHVHNMSNLRVREGRERFRLDGTDGKMLAVVRGPIATGRFLAPAGETPAGEYLVSAREVRAALQDANKKEPLCAVSCCEADGGAWLATAADTRHRLAKGGGRYPDTDSVAGEFQGFFPVLLDASLLKRACEIAAALAPKGEAPGLRLLLHFDAERPVGFFVEGEGGLTCEGMLMPIAPS